MSPFMADLVEEVGMTNATGAAIMAVFVCITGETDSGPVDPMDMTGLASAPRIQSPEDLQELLEDMSLMLATWLPKGRREKAN